MQQTSLRKPKNQMGGVPDLDSMIDYEEIFVMMKTLVNRYQTNIFDDEFYAL